MSRGNLSLIATSDVVSKRLIEKGMTPSAAESKAALFARSAEALLACGVSPTSPAAAWFVPGRIEVLGKHTDYAGGRSLTVATECGLCAVAVPREDQQVRVITTEGPQTVEFSLSASLKPTAGHWSNYPMTVAQRVASNFPGDLRGADIALASDLPLASGMSSSSALVITMFLLLAEVNRLSERDEYQRHIQNRFDLAGYLATIENGQSFGQLVGEHGVGTFGGSEDHTAILSATAGEMTQYSYCPVRKERTVAMPVGHVFAVAVSGVEAEKTGAAMEKYNRASQLAASAAEVWRKQTGRQDPHLAAAIASSSNATDSLREALQTRRHPEFRPGQLLNRFEHFLAESEEIIPAVAEELQGKNLEQFGRLVDSSQGLAESLLGNQVPELIYLAKGARELGAAASSAFGAGFGGSVWALVREDQAEKFLADWQALYSDAFPRQENRSAFFTTSPGPAAFAVTRLL